MKLSKTMKWILAAIGSIFLLSLCIVPLLARLIFMGIQSDFNMAEFRGRTAPFSQRSQPAVESEAEDDDRDQARPGDRFQERGDFKHRRGHDFRFGYGRSGRGFGPFSIFGAVFGLFGGLIRLAGLGLIALAALIWLTPRVTNANRPAGGGAGQTAGDGDDGEPDQGPDLTEADLKAAMKKLGISKLEVDEE